MAICFLPPLPFSLLPTHLSEHYYSSCPRCCRCRCTQFNFHPLLQCEGEGQVRGREDWGGGWQIQDCLHPFFFLSLKGIIIGAWCSSAHHDVAWISFSASGSSGDEYILTRSDRHTWSKYTRTTARSAATKVRVCLQSEAGLWSPAAVRLKHVCVHIRGNAHILFCSSAFTPSLAVLIE